jgi:hypothetical protein
MATIPQQSQAVPVATHGPKALSESGHMEREEAPVCPAAARSFAVGLVALRFCWLPGINCLLAVTSIALGVIAIWEIVHSRGAVRGLDEAISGTTLGSWSCLSVLFISALVAAWRRWGPAMRQLTRRELMKLAIAGSLGVTVLGARRGDAAVAAASPQATAVLVDIARCIGRRLCEGACKAYHGFPAGEASDLGPEVWTYVGFRPLRTPRNHLNSICRRWARS